MMVVAVYGIIRTRNLFVVVMLSGIYSFLMATVMVVLDAVDVAMTEAAVGAGMSTVLMLAVLGLVKSREAPLRHSPILPIIVCCLTGGMLIYGTVSLPPFGHIDNPQNQHVAPYYIENAIHETGSPNVVTAVLASYRGYDTLGETTVIFTGGVGVLVLLSGAMRRRSKYDDREKKELIT
jgi:multicomponent Na+:H+ antiporter subunit B|tara:strand:- start:10261 stop:10797 length:537 start_codon:yes stop_codon:yes gene_type:complete